MASGLVVAIWPFEYCHSLFVNSQQTPRQFPPSWTVPLKQFKFLLSVPLHQNPYTYIHLMLLDPYCDIPPRKFLTWVRKPKLVFPKVYFFSSNKHNTTPTCSSSTFQYLFYAVQDRFSKSIVVMVDLTASATFFGLESYNPAVVQ